jgi:hypothetical protein
MEIRTRLYHFNISGRRLIELGLPETLRTAKVAVVDVSRSGYMHLAEPLPGGLEPKDLGWFKVSMK